MEFQQTNEVAVAVAVAVPSDIDEKAAVKAYFQKILTERSICTNSNGGTYVLPPVAVRLASLGLPVFATALEEIERLIDLLPEGCTKTFCRKQDYVNQSHRDYHDETYGWHALACGLVCSAQAQRLGGDARIGFLLGFLHDIGKAFCETPKGFTFAHGQIGAHVAEVLLDGISDINPEVKQVMLFLIDQHMCTCTHSVGDHSQCFDVLKSMTSAYTQFQKEQFDIYYRALVCGDRVGKICKNPTTLEEAEAIANQIEKLHTAQAPKCSGTTFIVMHGPPGSGKSTASEKTVQNLETNGKGTIKVAIAERDRMFYIAAQRQQLIESTVSFEQFVKDEVTVDGKQSTRYKQFYSVLKGSITEVYAKYIEDLREKYDVIIIDSCISLNQQALALVVNPQDTVFVWNGFPQHQLASGRGGSLKIDSDKQVTYPFTSEGMFYRSIIEGANPKQIFRPLVCTSRVEELCSLITDMQSHRQKTQNGSSDKIIHPVEFLNGCDVNGRRHTLEDLRSVQPYIIVDQPKVYELLTQNGFFSVYRLGYRDGTQNGTGPFLHYRGEIILYDIKADKYYPLRVSLPVTPETGQMRKFPSHWSIYDNLTGLRQFLTREFSEPSGEYTKDTDTKCFMMPKPDGSLCNVSVVKKDSPQGCALQLMKDLGIAGKYLVEVNDQNGVVYFVSIGSKSCLFLTQTGDYEAEFAKCIEATFGTIEKMAYCVVNYIADNHALADTATVIFEMVPEHPHAGLTVDYGQYFTTHLATILFSEAKEGNIQIILPNEVSSKHFHGVKVTEVPCTPSAIADYFKDMMTAALAGTVVDLEGFMCAFQLSNGNIMYCKIKFPWYFAAHKPDSNFKEAEELSSNPKYDNIRDKLINLSLSSSKRDARRDPKQIFAGFAGLLSEAFIKFDASHQPKTKKDFMMVFSKNKASFTEYPGVEAAVTEALTKLDIKKVDCSIDKIVPSIWEPVSKLSNVSERTALIIDFALKAWKILDKF
jgi:hypothetical protein